MHARAIPGATLMASPTPSPAILAERSHRCVGPLDQWSMLTQPGLAMLGAAKGKDGRLAGLAPGIARHAVAPALRALTAPYRAHGVGLVKRSGPADWRV